MKCRILFILMSISLLSIGLSFGQQGSSRPNFNGAGVGKHHGRNYGGSGGYFGTYGRLGPRFNMKRHFRTNMFYGLERGHHVYRNHYGWGAYGVIWNSKPAPLYSSVYFVNEWSQRTPVREFADNGLRDSMLLELGMDQEAVMKVLGSPLERSLLDGQEAWKYSAYAVYFENGVLVGLR